MYRIILADDEEYVRELLSKNINQSMEGFQVVAKQRMEGRLSGS